MRRPTGDRDGQAAAQVPVASGGGIASGGANYGIASTGDQAVNLLIQMQVIGDAAVAGTVTELQAREIPLLSTFAEQEPLGRGQIVGQVTAELASGMSVQLYGAPGVGKKAVARAVIRQLRARPDPVRGLELLPLGGQPHTLDNLYERLTQSFFYGSTFDPPETRLRAAAAAANLTAVVVIGDCELQATDLNRLLGTFPGCTFLLTSGHRTLYRAGAAHEIGPLSFDIAIALIAQETGVDPAGLQRFQVVQAYELAAGRTQRLLQHAAFLRFARSRPGPDPLSLIPALEQAKILASGLSEQARRVLVALATFRTELTPGCFAAVTGLPAGPGLAQAGSELLAAALVTRASVPNGAAAGAGRAPDVAYRMTPDAAAAVYALGWIPADALTAGRGLLALVTWPDPGSPPPSPALLLAVASMLRGAGENLLASRLIRAALPTILKAGQVQDWMRLVSLGLQAAIAAGPAAGTDLAYFAREDLTRRWLLGDKLVTAGALAAAEQLGAHLAGPSRAQVVRHSGSVLRHAARYAGKAMSAGHGMVAAGAAAVTAAAVAVVVIAWPAGHPGPAQFTGIQLASALLPPSELPAGYSYTLGLNARYNSGSSLVTPQARPTGPADYSCNALGNSDGFVLPSGQAQMTGYAGNWGDKAAFLGSVGFSFDVSEAVYQFSGPAPAAAFFAAESACIRYPAGGSTSNLGTAPVDGDKAITGLIDTDPGTSGSAAWPLFVLHGADVFVMSAWSLPYDPKLTFPGAAGLIVRLIARVEALGPGSSPARTGPGRLSPAPASPSPAPSSPSATPSSPSPPSSSPPTGPAAVVQGYFAAINAHRYRQAWLLGGDNVSDDSYGQFVSAFAGTADDIVTIVSVTGSTVSIRLTAIQSNGTKRFFAGTYTVTSGAITVARIQQAG